MTDVRFTEAAGDLLREIRNGTPKDTGNLRYNATRKEALGGGRFRITVEERVAPYFRYVNGQRTIRGRKNEHYGYFENAVRDAVRSVAKKYGGRIERV